MQRQRKHTLGYSSGSTPRRDDDRNASSGGRREIDVVYTDPGAGDDTQPWGARKKRGINDGVGPNDRADGVGDILFAWIGNERNLLAEHTSNQRWIYGAKCHNHRTVDSHDLTRSQ
jgi:hypothetical protein